MRRVFFVALLFTSLLATPDRAEASVWDWIQELSGPGPSHGRGNVLATICGLKNDRVVDSRSKAPCFFADYRRFESDDSDNFPSTVKTTAYDFGPTWELWDEGQIEIGAGIGLMRFNSDNGTSQKTSHKFTITYMRVVIQPLSFIPGWERKTLPAILKWYVRETLIPGDLTAADFGVPFGNLPGQSTFAVKNDRVTSMGFLIDAGELLRRPFRR